MHSVIQLYEHEWTGDETDLGVENGGLNILRNRRQSNVNVDAIHEFNDETMAPAQLYATDSGRLFHSGKIAIVTVGLPARGKTHVTVALLRYLRWLGVKSRAFHLGDYRRAHMGPGKDVPHDYFFVNASAEAVKLRQTILQKCRLDLYHFFDHEKGQVAIYDAVNPLAEGRRQLAKEFLKHDIQTIFIESYVDDPSIIEENVRSVKISSPDYAGWNADDAVKHYIKRMEAKIPHFETMDEKELNYIKMINAGQKYRVMNCRFGYLPNRIVFYLMNLHVKSRRTYFARAGNSEEEHTYKADAGLSDKGRIYSKCLAEALEEHRKKELEEFLQLGGSESEFRTLTVWTSTRLRTIETADPLKEKGFTVRDKTQLSQLNPGDAENLTEEALKAKFPQHWEEHQEDPYHHRYPRAESYHDLAVRSEPIILELEREKNDLLIIAHESVLRVLYGYLMACSTQDIPFLSFPRNEIVEIIPASYNNEAKRIKIPKINTKGEHTG
ncbi:6-phosphofructo-2-kinase-domain-containing protein [Sphaerosporella brunnea]|uniref:6-phosphofructo-2-kinase-domain-containing protein n=1 Tax=Sphaerosporella brunnea TaxID=1250544 RepID=A0A5J5F824_9PEZI|nr:6-phosphofructo-2-kinase-domain-containing protein [Sphaerosporella brunnea]